MSGGFIGMLFYLMLFISIPITFSFLKKNGKPILAKIISVFIFLLIIILILSNRIESSFYFKYDAKKDLRLANLILKDDFEIINNNVVGMPERLQYTELKISTNDRNRIISEIENGKYYREDCKNSLNNLWDNKAFRNKIMFVNYSCKDEIMRESYYQENEYVPISIIASLSKESNVLKFSRIED